MTQPQDLTTELDALQLDADKWQAASDDIELAHTTVQNLNLEMPQFGWVADEHGLVVAYKALQTRMAGLLNGAFQEFDKIAVELRETAAEYGRTDTEAADRLNDIATNGHGGIIQEHQQGQGTLND